MHGKFLGCQALASVSATELLYKTAHNIFHCRAREIVQILFAVLCGQTWPNEEDLSLNKNQFTENIYFKKTF